MVNLYLDSDQDYCAKIVTLKSFLVILWVWRPPDQKYFVEQQMNNLLLRTLLMPKSRYFKYWPLHHEGKINAVGDADGRQQSEKEKKSKESHMLFAFWAFRACEWRSPLTLTSRSIFVSAQVSCSKSEYLRGDTASRLISSWRCNNFPSCDSSCANLYNSSEASIHAVFQSVRWNFSSCKIVLSLLPVQNGGSLKCVDPRRRS